MKAQLENAKIVRETEKALLVEVLFGDEFKHQVWFPKSQCVVESDAIFVATWLLDKKADEVARNTPNIATVWNSYRA